jgi:hypothetical protein
VLDNGLLRTAERGVTKGVAEDLSGGTGTHG